MQYKFYSIPTGHVDIGPFEEEMNRFLRGHRILSVKRELVADGAQSFWGICIEYLEASSEKEQEQNAWRKKERIDYREILSEEDFQRFALWRRVRKAIADQDAVPAYAIMHDDMLVELLKSPAVDEKALKALSGFGEKKFEKYGMRFLSVLKELEQKDEAGGKLV